MDSVRPNLGSEELLWVEQVQKIDDELDEMCYVCGVDGEVDEVEGDEEEVEDVVTGRPEDAAEQVQRYSAVKDDRVLKSFVDPRRPSAKDVEEHARTHLPYRN